MMKIKQCEKKYLCTIYNLKNEIKIDFIIEFTYLNLNLEISNRDNLLCEPN